VWIDAVPYGNTPPIGQPGQLVKWNTDPLCVNCYGEYAWNPQTNSWDTVLADLIGEINTTSRERYNAWFKAFNELVLANGPFLWANDYALLHRFKYELKYPA